MASVAALSEITGFSRESIKRRQMAFGLPANFEGKMVLDLKPIDQDMRDKKSLEEARRDTELLKAEKLTIELETHRKERVPIATLNAAMTQAFAEIRATIDSSALTQKQKDDICDALKEIPTRLRW